MSAPPEDMIEKDLQLCARKNGLRGQRVVKEETDDTAHCCCELGKEKEGEGGRTYCFERAERGGLVGQPI